MEEDNPFIPITGNNNSNTNPWSEFENNWLFHQFDNYLNGGALWQAAFPGESQYSEWSQQMVSTMYQNWYNSAPQQMKRGIEAGINPYLLAQGIAGVGNSSVASVPPAVNAPNLADVVSSAASGLSSLGSAFGNTAQGIATLGKLRHEISNIDANTASTFEQLGFTKLQSKALSVQLKYMDQKEQIGVWQALANFDKTKAEFQNLLAQHRNIVAQYDEIIAHKDLLIAQEGEVKAREQVDKAMKDKLAAEANWQRIENNFFVSHGYKLGSPVYVAIHDQMVSDGTFDMQSYGDIIAGYEGKVAGAVEDAKQQSIEDHAFNIAYESGRAAYDFNWDAPPKTMFEFLSKGIVKIKENLKESSKRLFKRGSKTNEVYEPSKQQLRQEYMSYKQQLENQRMLLKFRAADNIDEKTGKYKDIDEKIAIINMQTELDRMPQTYSQWLKYVKGH